MKMVLGQYAPDIEEALREIRETSLVERIWNHDHTVWKPEPKDIFNRLGWLRIVEPMQKEVPTLISLAQDLQRDGIVHAVLLGMGGSSLAPEVFRYTFGLKGGCLDLAILDSTDPDAVREIDRTRDLSRTLFIVSTKSGGTVETLSFFKYFYNRVVATVGHKSAGRHFIAITDPGSALVEVAKRLAFRETFLNDPDIGGRYSALSLFGLVPATLIGVDVQRLLERAASAMVNCGLTRPADATDSDAVRLGVIMAELAKRGRDKLTFILSDAISHFGDWVEQLIAESTGKSGTGILPVIGEQLAKPDRYGHDRFFVSLVLDNDDHHAPDIDTLIASGHPVVQFRLSDTYDLGAQIYIWEMATAVAGARLGINPFDQPNVESAKIRARDMVAAYHKDGRLPEMTPDLIDDQIGVYGTDDSGDAAGALRSFVAGAKPNTYIAIQAYVQVSGDSDRALEALRFRLRDRTLCAVTVGYGPRFLHSTGQLHKGDAGQGLFIQLTTDSKDDISIPDEAGQSDSSMSFGTLKQAQAMGDRQALLDAGRQVIRFHCSDDFIRGLQTLTDGV